MLEFILAFPLILIISLAIIEFGFFALLQQTVTVATIEGSREAAQVGTTTDSVGNLIKQYVALNSLNLVVTSPATSNAGNVLETGRCVTPLIRQKNQSSTQIRYVQ
ncbi:TadE/TadG family type IV pilus assembly protein [Gimesia maris]|uniref:TadE/TadG family type IV pilus assembly protein n=1 Tax=Gimesia maris TaxID=122 RepID=UPI0018D806AD|nr:TadE/TadG family type IV pilus assembly protein [Gimesia maris]